MTSTRRTYTREYKIEAVRLVTEEGYSTRQAAESLGVSQNALRTWKKLLEKEAKAAFPGKGKVSSHDEQLRRLQEENRQAEKRRRLTVLIKTIHQLAICVKTTLRRRRSESSSILPIRITSCRLRTTYWTAVFFEYIEVFYNRVRRHSTLGYVSPLEYELAS